MDKEQQACKFVKVADSALFESDLIDTLTAHLPRSVQLLNVLEIYGQKLYSRENIQFHFFSYESLGTVHILTHRNWNDVSKPLFIVCVMPTDHLKVPENLFSYRLLFSREESPSPRSIPAFVELFGLVGAKKTEFGTVNPFLVPYLEDVAKFIGKECKVNPNWTMYLPKEKWALILPPESTNTLKTQSLSRDHGKIVNSHWKFGSDKSLGHIEDCIEHSPVSGGVFASESLVSWAITLPIGTMNALHTLEGHRRKGFAAMTLRHIAKEAINHKIFPLCEIELSTPDSKLLFEKFGFVLAFDAAWIDMQ